GSAFELWLFFLLFLRGALFRLTGQKIHRVFIMCVIVSGKALLFFSSVRLLRCIFFRVRPLPIEYVSRFDGCIVPPSAKFYEIRCTMGRSTPAWVSGMSRSRKNRRMTGNIKQYMKLLIEIIYRRELF
ncbi:MAG: hypothetical protein D3916_17820, partial [Candidatus Electrothrix sp. MAN1_4]|nr:hypothetical protein [Candidatus Electrothrix sp. MAN1_4]